MRKIKISELPPCNSIEGLSTIGTDKDNHSVRVPFEFVERQLKKQIKHKVEDGQVPIYRGMCPITAEAGSTYRNLDEIRIPQRAATYDLNKYFVYATSVHRSLRDCDVRYPVPEDGPGFVDYDGETGILTVRNPVDTVYDEKDCAKIRLTVGYGPLLDRDTSVTVRKSGDETHFVLGHARDCGIDSEAPEHGRDFFVELQRRKGQKPSRVILLGAVTTASRRVEMQVWRSAVKRKYERDDSTANGYRYFKGRPVRCWHTPVLRGSWAPLEAATGSWHRPVLIRTRFHSRRGYVSRWSYWSVRPPMIPPDFSERVRVIPAR